MNPTDSKRIRIDVNGIVQGVGFRPTVYRYAKKRNLSGWVSNTPSGVIIELEGTSYNIDDFINNLQSSPPPQAKISDIKILPLPLLYDKDFKIIQSSTQEQIKTQRSSTTLVQRSSTRAFRRPLGLVQRSSTRAFRRPLGLVQISSDIATCNKCTEELLDPSDRRYLYPFLNCTNCGPRFTITEKIPYDRKNTTMEKFIMCTNCSSEYNDPENRRFHAQPNACPSCGPGFMLTDTSKSIIDGDPIKKTIKLLEQGKIVAIKGLGGFHLACDALNKKAVKLLRKRKYREDKPFALMASNVDTIRNLCSVSKEEERLLISSKRPIVLLRKKDNCNIPESIAPNNGSLGFMLPYTPLHHLLLRKQQILVMTSANISDEPIAFKNDEATSRLSKIADYFLLHNRDIYIRCDDSVTRILPCSKTEFIIRRSRGYVPEPITVPFTFKKEILSCGAHLKNTFALAKDNNAIISHHIGDLENWETLDAFEKGIEHFKDIFKINPEIIAHDMHPEYLSTKHAKKQENYQQLIGVQHHHAHIASCMADNSLSNSKVIGVAFDGTGYGTDGCIWGSEFLIADYSTFQRKAHLNYIPLPSSEQAIKEPYRMGIAYLYKSFGEDFNKLNIDFVKSLDKEKSKSIINIIESRLNSPLTSSMGRLFDAVSTLLGIRNTINYEGQAAIELELFAKQHTSLKPYNYRIINNNSCYLIDPISLIKDIVNDLQRHISISDISTKFHLTIRDMIIDTCKIISRETNIKDIVLSGGVFQNMILLNSTYNKLTKNGFNVYIHNKVPTNDGGISLGQAVIANYTLR